jgi:creatinine amidohydrolase
VIALKIEELTWNELDDMDKNKTILMLGFAPIEQHGKHLPLGTDVYLTKKWIQDTVVKLEEKNDYNILTLPTIPMGCSDIKGFPGNLYVSQKLVYSMVYEMISMIAEWGIKYIVVISAHADPKHQIAIEQACDKINKQYGKIVLAPMGAIFSNEKVGLKIKQTKKVSEKLAEYPNDFHAGWIETSQMLYYHDHLVREEYREIKEVIIKPRHMISSKKVNRMIRYQGHMGYPRIATKELGRELHESMVLEIIKAISTFIEGKDTKKYEHHFLYNIPFLRVKNKEI